MLPKHLSQREAKQAITQFSKTECVSWTPSEKGRGKGGSWHPAPVSSIHSCRMRPIKIQINVPSLLHSDLFLPQGIQKITWEIKITPNTITQRQPLWTLWYVIFQDHFIFKKQKWDHYLHPVLRPAFESAQHTCLSLPLSAWFPSLLNCLSSLSLELRAFHPFSYTPVDFQCLLQPRRVWKRPGSRSEPN